MALGGLAVAIGAMVDAAIVLIDRAQQRLDTLGPHADAQARWNAVRETAFDLGPTLFTLHGDHYPCPSCRSLPLKDKRAGSSDPWRSPKPGPWQPPRCSASPFCPFLLGFSFGPGPRRPTPRTGPGSARPAIGPSGPEPSSPGRRPCGRPAALPQCALSRLKDGQRVPAPLPMKGICCTCPPLIRGYRRGRRPASFSKRTGS